MDASTPLINSRNAQAQGLRWAAFLAVIIFSFSFALLLGCAGNSLDPGPLKASLQAEAFFCDVSSVECRSGAADFEVDKLRDLFIFVAWRGVQGVHFQELQLLLPDGNHYQTLATHFTTQQGLASAADVQVAQLSRGEPTVVSVLPVAGTFITQHLLTGAWRAQVYLDGKMINETTFVLRTPRQ